MPYRKSETTSPTASPLSRVRDLLSRPLRLDARRAGAQAPRGAAPECPGPSTRGSAGGEALRRGHDELRQLLCQHPETRHLMRHLGFVEQTLGRLGSRALRQDIPVPVMRKAIEQLDLLVQGAPAGGLAHLRERLADAVRIRSAAAEIDEQTETRPGSLEVSEASQSLFDEMERSWTGQVPVGNTPAASRG